MIQHLTEYHIRDSGMRIKGIIIAVLLVALCSPAHALDTQRFSDLPSCVFADDLSSIDGLEKQGYTVNGCSVVSSPYGNAISLDGTDDWIDTTSQNVTGGNYTICFRIYPIDRTPASGYIYLLDQQSSTRLIITTERAGATDEWGFYDGGHKGFTPAVPVTYNQWQDVAISFNTTGTVATIYIDGVSQGTNSTYSSRSLAATYWKLGTEKDNSGDYDFQGYIRDFVVFNRVLTATEVSDIHNNRAFENSKHPKFVAHMGITPTNIMDSTTGTNTSVTSYSIAPNGMVSTVYDGSADYTGFTVEDYVSSGDNLTIGILGKQSVAGDTRMAERSDVGPFRVYWSSGNFRIALRDSGGAIQVADCSIQPDTGEWFWAWGVVDGTTGKVYVNGEVGNTYTFANSGTNWTPNYDLYVARNGLSAVNLLNGEVAHIVLDNTAWTQTQIQDYEARHGRMK